MSHFIASEAFIFFNFRGKNVEFKKNHQIWIFPPKMSILKIQQIWIFAPKIFNFKQFSLFEFLRQKCQFSIFEFLCQIINFKNQHFWNFAPKISILKNHHTWIFAPKIFNFKQFSMFWNSRKKYSIFHIWIFAVKIKIFPTSGLKIQMILF